MDENLVQLILFILIGIVYAAVTIVKKIDRWIQVHRLPPGMREGQPGAKPQPAAPSPLPERPSSTEPRPARRGTPGAPPRTPFDLMRELEQALAGLSEEPEEKAPPSRPPLRPRPSRASVSVAEREEPSERQAVEPALQIPSFATEPKEDRAVPSGLETRDTPRVKRPDFRPLAVLRNSEDLRRGILIREILGPPRALRPRVR